MSSSRVKSTTLGARVTAILVWGPGVGVVAVSAYMGGTRGSGVLSSAGDVIERCRWSVCLVQGGVRWEVLG